MYRKMFWVFSKKAIVDNPPVVIRDGGVIAFGFDRKLDELRSFSDNAGKFFIRS